MSVDFFFERYALVTHEGTHLCDQGIECFGVTDHRCFISDSLRIEKALELAPDDAHILDSMGWVLFRRGDLEGAIRYLRKAFALRADVEIGVHLGEVLWQAGMQDEARRLWREAREREPANEVLRETLVRLNITL